MRIKQQGFTLIELVMVIAILGILAVIAIPKYINLSADANTAAINGVAGALSSANVINYSSRSENSSNGIPVANCTDVASTLQGGTLPSGYAITSLATPVGSNVTCTLNGPAGSTATFIATGIA